jgi:hypothetical protein
MKHRKMTVLFPPLFPDFNAPDLGCLVRRKHDLQIEDGNANVHVEFVPSIDFAPRFHQAYFRVKCGKAAFFERCMVHRTTDFSVPGPILEQFPPDFVLGGDFTPRPSDWLRYPASQSPQNYWFFGQFRNPAETAWRRDAIVAHAYDIYDNGTLSTVQYDDTGGDRDLNDLIIEVAIVGRTPIGILTQAVDQKAATLHFEQYAAPRIRAEIEKAKKK